MTSPLPRWTRRAALLTLGLAAAITAQAQTKPPVRIVVGFAAGGGVDTMARILAEGMGQALGQTFVVENRPGAGGLIAAQVLKAAPADGNTLMLTNDHTVAILPHTLKNPGFDTARDFAPVAVVSDQIVFALATHPGTGITQLKDIGAWARQNPGQANFGVPAPGSMPEFAVGLLAKGLQVDATPAAYRGGSPLVMDLSAGQIPFGVTSTFELMPFAKTGKVRLLAVSGSARQADLPDVPTFAELGIQGLELANVAGLYAPAGTPPAVIARYSEAVRATLSSAKTRERLQALGATPNYGGPDALAQRMQRISDAWGPVIRQSGYQPQ
ncbi:Bug family tripartite tricarboxylate transporter substrate binding protein [Variovorax sp. J22P271]|uniref:Bug family tripartite tricarboxylate transporter substrate binding protein n=1 Tax=Variovorax davisae TaxID=3053515 RepID=UPI002576A683|nr:Bug family tripartite tricarboxylate transporter substrate binding protein [Variovorax sp. J22P271]MDM0036325.1 Bug family tripartite tricarboxylate transporter substrate binding protein [Variovorax sp. J22P271]